jgi:hypothetical protein
MNSSSAFNNINAVKFYIATQWGVLSNSGADSVAWGPGDVQIEATPGNDGNLYNEVDGMSGDVLLCATPIISNWTVSLHFLYKSKTYCKFSYLMQKEYEAMMAGEKTGWYNFRLEDYNDMDEFQEGITSPQAKLLTIPGKQWGAGIDGDATFTFKLLKATYTAPGYDPEVIPPIDSEFPLRNEDNG